MGDEARQTGRRIVFVNLISGPLKSYSGTVENHRKVKSHQVQVGKKGTTQLVRCLLKVIFRCTLNMSVLERGCSEKVTILLDQILQISCGGGGEALKVLRETDKVIRNK